MPLRLAVARSSGFSGQPTRYAHWNLESISPHPRWYGRALKALQGTFPVLSRSLRFSAPVKMCNHPESPGAISAGAFLVIAAPGARKIRSAFIGNDCSKSATSEMIGISLSRVTPEGAANSVGVFRIAQPAAMSILPLLISADQGVAICHTPLLKPSPVVSPGALSFFQV
jgi:hypothetical protein